MAKITETKPNIQQWQFKQEKGDSDYGTCLWAMAKEEKWQ